jgi:hypothetical protein
MQIVSIRWVCDLINQNWWATGEGDAPEVIELHMSPTVLHATNTLREFMYQHVYLGSAAKTEDPKVEQMLNLLFKHFMTHPEKIPADIMAINAARGEPLSQAVVDYVAGMTDTGLPLRYSKISTYHVFGVANTVGTHVKDGLMTNNRVIEQIKERIDIVEFISEHVRLRKTGRSFVGFCPFHANTNTPAFTVYPDSQSYHCFGCKASGTVFDFVMRQQGIEFREALEQLAQRTGIEPSTHAPRRGARSLA